MKTLYTKTISLVAGLAFGLLCISPLLTTATPGGEPTNDLCSTATAITCGDALAGTNVGATEQSVPTANGGTVGPGVWYTFTGNGDVVTLSTCNAATFDTEINVVTGLDCNTLTNVAGNDDFGGCSGSTSELSFTSVNGTPYYVYVSDFISGGSNVGTFTLSMSCTPPPPPANDLCGDAIALNCGDVVSGTIVNATAVGEPNCGAGFLDPAIWYSFVGDGSAYNISLTSVGFDPFLIVTSTACGTGVACDASDDDGGTGLNSLLSGFATTNGVTYYIYVTEALGAEMDDFELSLTSSACAPPANDLCADAVVLECGDALAGTTVDGTISPIVTTAGIGVWYAFEGNGMNVTLSTCDAADFDTEITVLTGADCNSLSTLASNDDFSGCSGSTSELEILAETGTTYYVYVSHFSNSSSTTGTFTLSATCVTPPPPPANDLCADAVVLECGDALAGTTVGGTTSPIVTTAGIGVWYAFEGNGTDVTFSTCGAADFDTEITVLTGADCNSLTTFDFNDDFSGCSGSTSELELFTVFGTTYYVYVSHYSNSSSVTGTFTLSATCNCTADAGTITADAGPACLDAGTATITATHDGNSTVPTDYLQVYILTDAATGVILDFSATASFDVTATGDYVIHTAIYDPLQFNPATVTLGTTIAQIDALTIDGGGTMCASVDLTGAAITVSERPTAEFIAAQDLGTFDVDFTDETTGDPTSWEWDFAGLGTSTDQNPSYTFLAAGSYDVELIAINACGSDTDTVAVNVAPLNDLCEFAQVVTCGSTVLSSNVGATISAPSGCAFGAIGEGVWFSLVGDGSQVTASTCSANTEIDTEMSVFTGDCNSLVCEAGNDDDDNCVTDGFLSTVVFIADAGVTYYIYVGSYTDGADEFGNIELSITCTTAPVPPANDDCAGAISLTAGETCSYTSGDVAAATESMPACDAGDPGTADDDVWFSFVATTTTATTIEVVGSNDFDAVFEVFEGDACGALSSIACQDTSFSGGTESVEVTLIAGQTYYVRVYDWYDGAPSTTTFDICVYAVIVGVSDVALSNNLNVYPNPSNGEFVIEIKGIDGDASITVADLSGRTVYSEAVQLNSNFRKNMNINVANGTYLLQIETTEGTVTRKILVD